MKIAGIIAEYNPFHKGHEYHMAKTRELTGADYIIAVMSGDYVQRGVPAIADKYMRTKMALEGGADLVIELPTVYATASAEYFAQAGVRLLHSLNCVDYLSFGCEGADLSELMTCANLFLEEPEEYKNRLHGYLEEGYNFPKARDLAAKEYLKENNGDVLTKPNNILGIEYLKALKRLGSKMVPVCINRSGAGYSETRMKEAGDYQSATAIRKNLKSFENKADTFCEEMRAGLTDTPAVREFLSGFLSHNYMSENDLMDYFDYVFLMGGESLKEYFGVTPDLLRRFKNLYEPGWTHEKMIEAIHSKSMTDTALSRAVLHMALSVRKRSFLEKAGEIPVPYARILGFRRSSSALLKRVRNSAGIDLIQKPVEGKYLYGESENGWVEAAFLYDADIRSANLYERTAAKKSGRSFVNEYKKNMIIV